MALSIKVTNVVVLSNMRLLVAFENGVVKLFDVRPIAEVYPEFNDLKDPDLFSSVRITPGGYGIVWTPLLDASEGELWQNGIELPLTPEDISSFAALNVIGTAEACAILTCSRQNIDDLVRRDKLHPLRSNRSGRLFLKSEVISRAPH